MITEIIQQLQVDQINFSYSFRALRGKEGKLEPGSEVDESAEEDDGGDEDDEAMGNSSSQMKQTSLFGLVLMAGQLMALFA